jgi:3-dehydroquinate dehydratase I
MICVALQENNVEKCLQILKTVELAEIRIDLAKLSEIEVAKIFSNSSAKLIATCRPDNYSDEARMKLLKTAISSGAAYVDIEIESETLFTEEMVLFAKQHETTVIISYHNYENTPSSAELNAIIQKCFELGADIAKIATLVITARDNARLLALYDTSRKVIILGMGQIGKMTRVMAPFLGSPFTFAALTDTLATAPGQITAENLKSAQTFFSAL